LLFSLITMLQPIVNRFLGAKKSSSVRNHTILKSLGLKIYIYIGECVQEKKIPNEHLPS